MSGIFHDQWLAILCQEKNTNEEDNSRKGPPDLWSVSIFSVTPLCAAPASGCVSNATLLPLGFLEWLLSQAHLCSWHHSYRLHDTSQLQAQNANAFSNPTFVGLWVVVVVSTAAAGVVLGAEVPRISLALPISSSCSVSASYTEVGKPVLASLHVAVQFSQISNFYYFPFGRKKSANSSR